MNIYVINDHDTHYPVGGASVVVAEDDAQARELLDAALRAKGLDPGKGYILGLLDTTKPAAYVVCDGNY